jgi:CRP/FNR family transcriptional regulator
VAPEGHKAMSFQLSDFFTGGNIKNYAKNQVIIYEGDPIRSLFYIESGYVKVFNIINDGSERIIFIYGPGDIFPLSSHLRGSRMVRYFYVSMSDVQVRVIDPAKLEKQIKNDILKGEVLVNYTNSINQQFFQRIDILSVNDARRKIVALLAFLLIKSGNHLPMSQLGLSLTHQDIANMSGLSREATSRQIGLLKKEGILSDTRVLTVNVAKLNTVKAKLSITI